MDLKITNNIFSFYKYIVTLHKHRGEYKETVIYTDDIEYIKNYAKNNNYSISYNSEFKPTDEQVNRLVEINQVMLKTDGYINSYKFDAELFIDHGVILNITPCFDELRAKYADATFEYIFKTIKPLLKEYRTKHEENGPLIKGEYFEADAGGKINTIGVAFGALLKENEIRDKFSGDKAQLTAALSTLNNTTIDWKVKSGKRIPLTIGELKKIATVVLDYVVICHKAEVIVLNKLKEMGLEEATKYNELYKFKRGSKSPVPVTETGDYDYDYTEEFYNTGSLEELYTTTVNEILNELLK